MKNAIILFLTFIILASTAKEGTMVAFFKINQTSIIQKFCVNKEKPRMMCHGQCYLKKKMETVADAEQNRSNAQNAEKPTPFSWLIEDLPVWNLTHIEVRKKSSFFYKKSFSQAYLSTLFQPPRQFV